MFESSRRRKELELASGEVRSRASAQRVIVRVMPPGPAYNWLCVLHSISEILSHAARYRATQIAPRFTSSPLNSRKRRRTEETVDIQVGVDLQVARTEKSSGHEPFVNTSSITQNVDIQVRNTHTILLVK